MRHHLLVAVLALSACADRTVHPPVVVHTTLHAVGDPVSLDALAKRVLGVALGGNP